MIQMRPQGGGLAYAPNRDLVNCFVPIARRAAYCLAHDVREPCLNDFLERTNTTDEDLGASAMALAQFINECRKPELDTPEQALKNSGFLDLPDAAQFAILAKIGQVTLAMYYGTSRDALRVDEKPLGMDALLQTAEKICEELQKAKKNNSKKHQQDAE